MRSRIVFAFAILSLLLIASCGVPKGRFRLSGKYENIKLGDFLIFSPDGGMERIDTLHLLDGEFEYECDVNGDATFCIVYPNNSQLVVWTHGGDNIRIDGDVNNLWNVKVEGNDENALYTEFRQQNPPTDTVKLRKSAAQFIRQNPGSRVSAYLLTQYFVVPDGVPADSTERLYKVIQKALPTDDKVVQLGGVIKQRYALHEGAAIPAFDIVTSDSVHHTPSKYKGKSYVFYFWAGWQSGATYLHEQLSRLRNELQQPTDGKSRPTDISLLGYSLDVDTLTLRINRPTDEQKIPTYCDLEGFNSPLVNQFGIRTLPTFIIVGADGKIKCLTTSFKEVEKVLKDK